MSARWLGVLRWLHAAAVWAYPWRFRAAFGDEMRTVFAETLAAAHAAGPRAVLALCARELHGWLLSLPRQYARAWRAEVTWLRTQAVQPSWLQALAAIAPGVLIVSGYWLFRLLPSEYVAPMTWLAWGLALVLLALGLGALRRGWRHTAWAWPAVGLLAWLALAQVLRASTNPGLLIQHGLFVGVAVLVIGVAAWRGLRLPRAAWLLLGVMVVLALGRAAYQVFTQSYFGADNPLAYRAYLVLAGLLPAALVVMLLVPGRLIARWHGVSAVLLLLGPCALLIDLLADPTYGVRSSPVPSQALWAPLLRSLLYGGLLIVVPLWVLRARTAAQQVSGVAVGLVVALAGVLVIPYFYWRHQMMDLMLLAEISLGLLAALAAFAWAAGNRAPQRSASAADTAA